MEAQAKFSKVIANSDRKRSEWAAQLGIGRAYLWMLLEAKKLPSLELATKIEVETEGQVLAGEWVCREPSNFNSGVVTGNLNDGQGDEACT